MAQTKKPTQPASSTSPVVTPVPPVDLKQPPKKGVVSKVVEDKTPAPKDTKAPKTVVVSAPETVEPDSSIPVNADGTLTIHGVAKKVAAPGTITVNNGKVTIKTLFKIKLKDFITGSYIGSQIAEEAAITVNCEYQ